MTEQVTIRDIEDLNRYEREIKYNLKQSQEKIKRAANELDAFDFFQMMKFDKCINEPLSGEPENMIEVVNQSMTYIVFLKAVEILLKKYPGRSFTVNWGNIAGYDIKSMDEKVICECFAATSYKSNGKLTADLKRLDKNDTAEEKYEFFYDREFRDSMKAYYEEKYQGIKIIHFDNLDL